jgi:poly-gamma-glutamate capsule biosynthesis protein CapA/YwtB (metallophosphatase superfamily)
MGVLPLAGVKGEVKVSSTSLILWNSSKRDPVVTRVAIAGDFLPAGGLSFTEGKSWSEMARGLSAYFKGVGTSFANLEGTVDTSDLRPRHVCGLGQTISAPTESLDYLRTIHARSVGIANNHAYDFCSAGVDRTRNAISQHDMIPLGAGCTLQSSPEVFVWRGPGEIAAGFWAAAIATSDPATQKSRGVEPATVGRALKALELMKERGARFCVALLHAGCMRTNRPNPEDIEVMDRFAQCGFDIVAASHSHRISGARLIYAGGEKPSFCFYGLGSLVSGLVDSRLDREGLVVVAGLCKNGNLTRVEIRPVWLNDRGFGEIPSPEFSRMIFGRFRDLSDELAAGSCKRSYYRDTSRGLISLYLRDARAAFQHSGIRGLARKAGRVRMRHLRKLAHMVIG